MTWRQVHRWPLMALVTVCVILPVISLVVISFWITNDYQFIPAFTVQNYLEFAEGAAYRTLLLHSLKIALITATAATAIGGMAAYGVYRLPRAWQLPTLFATSAPFLAGEVLRLIGLMNVIGPTSHLAEVLGANYPEWLMHSDFGVVLGLLQSWITLPLLVLYLSFTQNGDGAANTASTLGAPPIQVFRRVFAPMNLRPCLVAFVCVFVASLAAHIPYSFLGGAMGAGYSVGIAHKFEASGTWALGAVMVVALLSMIGACYLCVVRLAARR